MRKRHTSTRQSIALTAAITTGMVFVGCGKGSSSDENSDGGSTAPSSDPTTIGGGSAKNAIVLSGQLAITDLQLTGSTKGVLAFNSRQGQFVGDPQEISVEDDGRFKVELVKQEEAVKTLVEEAAKPRDQRDLEKMAQSARSIMGGGKEINAEMIRNMPEEEIQSGIGDIAGRMQKSGPVTLLVAYDKSDDIVARARSFRFISMNTPGGRALSSLPNERLKGDVNLGRVSGSKRDVVGEARSTDAFDLPPAALETLADIGRSMKNVINNYMNKDWTAQPFYFWESTDRMADVMDKFSDVNRTSYKGFGFYIGSQTDFGLTYADLCGAKAVTFTPPSPITVAGVSGTVASYSNAGSTQSTQGSSRTCNGNGYYAREDVRDGRTSYMLNFGTGGSITSTPPGLWDLSIDGRQVGRYDFDLASPMVDGKPVVLMPRAKFITSGGQVTGVEVELYHWNGSGFEKVEDLGGFRRIVSEFQASVTRQSDQQESMAQLKIGDDNRITGAFDGSLMDQGQARNPAISTSDLGSFAIYYVIANASYRVEFR